MRKLVALCLIAGVALGAFPWACASPEPRRGACRARFSLQAEKAFDAPLDRWLAQLADMAEANVKGVIWQEGFELEVELRMGSRRAFVVELTSDAGRREIACDFLESPVRVEDGEAVFEAGRALCEAVVAMPSSGRAIPQTGWGASDALTSAGVCLRALAAECRARSAQACQGCGACEVCRLCDVPEAAALLLESFAQRLHGAGAQNLFLATLTPLEGEGLPLAPGGNLPVAQGVFWGNLIERAALAWARAVAENDV